MTNRIKIKAETPCYIHDGTFNPYRLTPYVATNGEVWLEAEGNGAGDDIMLEDISGWPKEEINEKWGDIDLEALLDGADEIEDGGDEEAADYIRDWAYICAKAII